MTSAPGVSEMGLGFLGRRVAVSMGSNSPPLVSSTVTYAVDPSGVTATDCGLPWTCSVVRTRSVASSMTVTEPTARSSPDPRVSTTKARDPSGVMAMLSGSWPTGIGAPAVPVRRSIGVTVWPDGVQPVSTTSARSPDGVTAIPIGATPVGIGRPARPVATSIGTTEPMGCVGVPSMAARTVLPSGVTATAPTPGPTVIGAIGVPVTRSMGVTVSAVVKVLWDVAKPMSAT